MNYSEDLVNLIHAEVMRVLHRSTRRTPVVVDGYDKKTHAVKLKLMPESGGDNEPVITGWIPLHTAQTGNKAGFYSPPNINDHGWLEFSDDDREGGTFTHAAFNDKFPPDDTVEAGELKYIHPATQTQMYFKKDGTVIIRGMNTSGSNGGNNTGSADNHKQTITLNPDGSVHTLDKAGQSIVMNGTDTVTITDAAGDVITMANGEIDMTSSTKVHITSAKITCEGKVFLGSDSASLPVKLCDDSCASKVFAE